MYCKNETLVSNLKGLAGALRSCFGGKRGKRDTVAH